MQLVKQIEVEDVLDQPEYQLIDVRTVSEFSQGKIPDSINIPLFDEEERARIGAVYKKNAKAARFLAMDILSPNISRFVRKVHGASCGKVPVAVCWRGGMRSKAAVQLLGMAGIDGLQLRGGYKRFRQYVYQQLQSFQLEARVIVLKGKSGTGKTDILRLLAQKGFPVLDLEGLACHRGSTFGTLENSPATQKDFDALLLRRLNSLSGCQWILVEGESKRIGNIYLPDFLFQAMRNAPVVVVEGSLPVRVQRILRDYTPTSLQARLTMYRALYRLRHRLSRTSLIELKQCLDREDYRRFAELILLRHYDNTYDYQIPGKEVLATVNSDDIEKAAAEIIAVLNNVK